VNDEAWPAGVVVPNKKIEIMSWYLESYELRLSHRQAGQRNR